MSLEEKRGLETWRRVQEDVPGPVVFLHPGSVYQVPRACPAEDTAVSETGKTPRPRGGGGARDKLQTACHVVYQKGHEPWRNDTVGKDHGESGWFAILDKVDEGDLCLGGDIGAET